MEPVDMSEEHDFLKLTKEKAQELYKNFEEITRELRKEGRVVGFELLDDDYDLDREVFEDKDKK